MDVHLVSVGAKSWAHRVNETGTTEVYPLVFYLAHPERHYLRPWYQNLLRCICRRVLRYDDCLLSLSVSRIEALGRKLFVNSLSDEPSITFVRNSVFYAKITSDVALRVVNQVDPISNLEYLIGHLWVQCLINSEYPALFLSLSHDT